MFGQMCKQAAIHARGRRIRGECQRKDHGGSKPFPKILHICGNVDRIVADMGQTGENMLAMVEAARAAY
jgi:hypothetical protein